MQKYVILTENFFCIIFHDYKCWILIEISDNFCQTFNNYHSICFSNICVFSIYPKFISSFLANILIYFIYLLSKNVIFITYTVFLLNKPGIKCIFGLYI